MDFYNQIKEIPDFPKKGILYRDMGPLMKDPKAWQEVIKHLANFSKKLDPDYIAGIESRGFIVGSSLATSLNIGFLPIRKQGKLAGETYSIEYELEYGIDRLEIQVDAFNKNSKILVIDDLLATGGTAKAAGELVQKSGALLSGYGFIIELSNLNGRNRLKEAVPIKSIISY